MKKIILCKVLLLSSLYSKAQLFSQDFQSSTILSSYISTTPSSGQFNAIGTSNTNSEVTIENNSLKFTRLNSSTSVATFSRTTDFSTAPQIITYKFDLRVSGNTTAQTTAAIFQVGSGFGTSNSAESNANTHSRFAINLTANNGEFQVRDNNSSSNGVNTFTGNQTITWIINNSTSSYTYTSPDGNQESVAAETWDLYVGTSKQLNDRAATTDAQSLTDIKFSFSGGIADIFLDNFQINTLVTLPITLKSFTAKPVDKNILLTWQTLSEKNNKNFEVQRSFDGKSYKSIRTVEAAENSDTEKNYEFTDQNPYPGTNYYKLIQYDFDGKTTFTETVVDAKLEKAKIIVSTSTSTVDLLIASPNTTTAKVTLFNMEGKKLDEQSTNLKKGINILNLNETLKPGVYFINLITESSTVSTKFIK